MKTPKLAMAKFTPSRMQAEAAKLKARWGLPMIYLALVLLTTFFSVAVKFMQS